MLAGFAAYCLWIRAAQFACCLPDLVSQMLQRVGNDLALR